MMLRYWSRSKNETLHVLMLNKLSKQTLEYQSKQRTPGIENKRCVMIFIDLNKLQL